MNPFVYYRPESLEEALALLDEHGPAARLLAGGTDLLVRMQKGDLAPRVVIDIKKVKQLRGDIQEEAGQVRIGALAALADLCEDENLGRRFPALVEAARVVGSVQIRNRATLAGNICNASPAADTAPALLVYEAVVNVAGKRGRQGMPIDDFFVGPGKTALQRGEMVTSIDLPQPEAKSAAAFTRLTRRRGVDLAVVSACCRIRATGETAFAFGAAAARPMLVVEASGRLADPQTSEEERDEILRGLIAQAAPISDMRASREYREAMLLALCRRAMQASLARRVEPVEKG